MVLKENEVLEDLERDNLFIIQDHNKYCFAIDSVLLSDFVDKKKGAKVIELCSGCGVISILTNAKQSPESIIGFELDFDLWDMSCRSLKYNNIHNIKFINDNISNVFKYVDCKNFDCVISNPPYYKKPKNNSTVNQKNLIAKYEIETDLKQVLEISSKLLKDNGRLFLSFPCERLQEVLKLAFEYKLISKQINFVYSKNKNTPNFMLVKFVKGAKLGVKIFFQKI